MSAEVPRLDSAPHGATCDHCYNAATRVVTFGGRKWYACRHHTAAATTAANDLRVLASGEP